MVTGRWCRVGDFFVVGAPGKGRPRGFSAGFRLIYRRLRRRQLGLDLGCGCPKRSKFFRSDVLGKIHRRYGRNLQPVFSRLGWFFVLLLVLFDDIAQIRFNRVVSFGVVFFLIRFRFLRWECDPFFPSSFFARGARAAGTIGMLHGRKCPRESTRLGGLGSVHDLVFKLGENA